ncbi:response regulator [Qipengyuania sp. MTN3-11]|uniref:response regulator n=1 Tax=Qipengyuania sp. MTN3-11 TaxID=3056557 RepID=UPI0036F2073A
MSDEIRVPMNGMLGFAGILQKCELAPEPARYADIIAHSGRAMMAILDDMLDLAKIEAGEVAIEHRSCDVARLVEECAGNHRMAIEEGGRTLEVVLDRNTPRVTATDPIRLRRILGHLLSHAAQAGREGGVTVALAHEENALVIEVGGGDLSNARQFPIAISKELARKIGGSLTTRTSRQDSSRAVLRLPHRNTVPVGPVERRGHLVEEHLRFPGTGRLLLVENYDATRRLIQDMLGTFDLMVETATDGDAAVDRVLDAEHGDRPYDLVLMALRLPGCDGFEAARALRLAGLTGEHLPIIALTADVLADDTAAMRAAGMQGHLTRPINFDDLRAVLRRWLPYRIVGEDGPRASRTASVETRWRERREQAFAAAREALGAERLAPERAREITALMHKVAGSAALFGESELGRNAAVLEHALLADAGTEARRRAAKALLSAT